ncbi:short-chain family oxidoreductase [Streptomyces bingchenggensis BCW-1]|uniref:Short-chain family oxidoreductase n=1 Tax=Streptomyces bingchenggensis (strain BCW-1) TaxID=749414 RepID=D7CDY1_STRBB|nr:MULTISPECIES: SDR family oxidoreductase [Streptomyces]ADI04646.1 short-chain family oxidoreductase [Streptomyces bingchenggensis BCW-1]
MPASERFEGRVAMVTGAGSGIGRASALAFAAGGAAVGVCDIDTEGGKETVALIEEAGGAALFVHTDVASGDAVRTAVDAISTAYGGLHFAHNNAGTYSMALTGELAEADFTRVVNVNLLGVFLCMRYQIPAMLEVSGGAIVNTTSIWAHTGMPTQAAYVASKHGVAGLTKTAAVEYAAQGIRVNAVSPGYIDTPMTAANPPDAVAAVLARQPIGRPGRPEEVAAAVTWLCGDEASLITGSVVNADGGYLAW